MDSKNSKDAQIYKLTFAIKVIDSGQGISEQGL